MYVYLTLYFYVFVYAKQSKIQKTLLVYFLQLLDMFILITFCISCSPISY